MHLSLVLFLVPYGLLTNISPEQLETKQVLLAGDRVAVGDDGSIWTIDLHRETRQERDEDEDIVFDRVYLHRQLVRFDQGQWKVVQTELKESLPFFVPGAKGVMLVGDDRQWTLYQGSKKIASGGITGLLEDHRELIVRAFGPDHSPSPFPAILMIAANREGQIWCLDNGALKVLVGGRWRDALEPLTRAGSRSGHLEYLVPLGNGRRVYVSDLAMRHDGGRSFVGQFEGGKLRFADAPHAHRERNMALGLRDREGATWISAIDSKASRACDMVLGHSAYRFDKEGNLVQHLNKAGWVCLTDDSNNIWLNKILGNSRNRFSLWRDGKIVQELQIPDSQQGSFLFADGPGSIYAFTGSKLQHLSADPPDFQRYRIDRLYTISGLKGGVSVMLYSRQRWFVVKTTVGDEHILTLVQIPAAKHTAATSHSSRGPAVAGQK